jgi:molybdate transport system ATP-binding protein
VVDALAADEHPGVALVRVVVGDEDAGHATLLARVTRRSAASLGLEPGTPVWVQIKSVALLEG